MSPNSPILTVTSTTVRAGDVIQVGGQPLMVADLVTLPSRAKRLRFATGETLTMHARTQLLVVRDDGRW